MDAEKNTGLTSDGCTTNATFIDLGTLAFAQEWVPVRFKNGVRLPLPATIESSEIQNPENWNVSNAGTENLTTPTCGNTCENGEDDRIAYG